MKTIFTCCILLLFISCSHSDRNEIDRLNRRITHLEQRIDSLMIAGNKSSLPLKSESTQKPTSYGFVKQTARCQALTKKRTQCKRTARSNGYCWQHGG